MRQQEERLTQSADVVKDLKNSAQQADLVISNKDERIKALESKTKACQSKLEEAQEQLKRNEQTVRCLHPHAPHAPLSSHGHLCRGAPLRAQGLGS